MVITLLLLAIVIFSDENASAQTNSQSEPLRGITSGESLDVVIDPIRVSDNGLIEFKIAFQHPDTGKAQPHVDYDLVIMKNGKELFRASTQTGGPLIHSPDGNATVFYRFNSPGNYLVEIDVAAIQYRPIKQEIVSFPLMIAPEFPTGFASGTTVVAIASVLAASKFKIK